MPAVRVGEKITLTHPKGASCEIMLYGATVFSWKSPTQFEPELKERLFLSDKSFLNGSKPLRGGIPVVFPCFGPPSHPDHLKLPQHGFARSEKWSYDDTVAEDEEESAVTLTLEPTPSIKSKYTKPFKLVYTVILGERHLSTVLEVTNPSTDSALEFQALFHNYVRAPSDDVLITPLQHTFYYDKTATTEVERDRPREEDRQAVDVRKFTDSVYQDPKITRYYVSWPGHNVEIRAANLPNVVVWNPHKENGLKMADMEKGGWERFVCVEPGHVRGFVHLSAGEKWEGRQTITIHH